MYGNHKLLRQASWTELENYGKPLKLRKSEVLLYFIGKVSTDPVHSILRDFTKYTKDLLINYIDVLSEFLTVRESYEEIHRLSTMYRCVRRSVTFIHAKEIRLSGLINEMIQKILTFESLKDSLRIIAGVRSGQEDEKYRLWQAAYLMLVPERLQHSAYTYTKA